MPNLSIKNVPQTVVEKLRQRAATNHRSLQGELMALVCQAAKGTNKQPLSSLSNSESGTLTIEEIAAEHRASYPEPFTKGPTAKDIIRADRDARSR